MPVPCSVYLRITYGKTFQKYLARNVTDILPTVCVTVCTRNIQYREYVLVIRQSEYDEEEGKE